MIETKIKIDLRGVCSPSKFFLGNQYENIDHILKFEFDEELDVMNKYIILNHQERTVIYPLINNQIKITNSVTSYSGFWNIHVMCRDFEVDLDAEPIELDAKEREHVYISNSFLGIVNKANFKKEDVENYEMDENLQIIYDDLLALKKELESGTIKDVKINDTSIVENGVANIPHNIVQGYFDEERIPSTYSVANAWTNIEVYNGFLNARRATNYHIDKRGKEADKACLMPEQLDYAVKAAMCDGKGAEWDTTEQANAKKRIGIDRDLEFLSNAIEGKTTQPYIDNNFKTSLTDSDKGLLKNIDVRGKTEQIQYSGKNLLNVPQTLIFTQYKSLSDLYIPRGTYALSFGTVTSGGENPPTARFMYEDGTEYAWHTLYSNKTYKINTTQAITKIHLYSNGYTSSDGAGIDCTLENLQLEVGETATSYEPYVGGIPSPSLDYPQEMESTNKLDVKICGRNIFDLNNLANVTNITLTETGFKLKNMFAQPLLSQDKVNEIFKHNETYRCNLKVKCLSKPNTILASQNAFLLLYDPNNTSNTKALCGFGANNSKDWTVGQIYTSSMTFTMPSDISTMRLLGYTYIGNNDGSTTRELLGEFEVIDFIIAKGDGLIEEYEAYQEQVISYELPIKMNSLSNDVDDYIDLQNETIKQRIKQVTFNGSEDWHINTNYTTDEMNVFQLYVDDSLSGYVDSDSFIYSKANNIGTIRNGGKFIMCSVSSSKFSTIDDWKVFLQNNSITINYLLENSIEHELPSELINQLKALYTYYGATNVISSLPIKFDYKLNMPSWYGIISKTVSDTRNIIYDMETQTLQNSIDTAYLQMMMEEGVY